jgi:anaerobic magnesium-protoporphyrin IX monomethyl ester cyclase
MNKIILFNPKSAEGKYRIPNSILSIAASIEGRYDWTIVDGNRDPDPLQVMENYLDTGEYKYIGFTVMPGPQLRQAIPIAKAIKEKYPSTKMIWGGYFPSTQPKVILESGYVDFVINGPGDHAFPALIDALEYGTPFEFIKNIIYKAGNDIIKNPKEDLMEQDPLPPCLTIS